MVNNEYTATQSDSHMDAQLKTLLSGEAPAEVQERCAARFQSLQTELQNIEHRDAKHRRSRLFFLRPAWAGGGIVFTLIVLGVVSMLTAHSQLTWADVVNTFKTVRFFSATVYVTEDPLMPPVKIELWRAQDGKIRIHYQGLVFFGQGDRLIKVFHVDDAGREADIAKLKPQEMHTLGLDKPLGLLKMMGSMKELSFDTILAHFCGRSTISPPIANAEASISADMQVFDVTRSSSPDWLRIWALRDSRLPVRLRSLDPRYGDSVDVLFEYMKEQPASAFDPDAFKDAIRKADSGSNRVYALLRDPGGREMTPQDVFKSSGYHMPELKRMGRTSDGVVWVESINARNFTKQGQVFDGFGKLTDNLGQEYIHCPVGTTGGGGKNDLTLEYFIPLTYRLDYRKPTSYLLTCWSRPDHYSQPSDIVGSLPVSQWLDGSAIPAFFGKAPGPDEALRMIVEEVSQRADWDRFDRLLALIPGEPESSALALFREEQRLHKMVEMGRHEEILALAARLYPLAKGASQRDLLTASAITEAYALELVRKGEVEKAKALIHQQIEAIRKSHESFVLRFFVANMYGAVKEARPTSDIPAMFPEGILEDPEVAKELKVRGIVGLGQRRSVEEMKQGPETAAWRKYLERVARNYEKRALPETMEFLTGAEAFNEKAMTLYMDLPGHPGYSVFEIPTSWDAVVRDMAYSKGWDPRLIRVEPSLKEQKIQAVCVLNKGLKPSEAIAAYMVQAGVAIVDLPTARKVWVARYDGRKLPYSRWVKPLEWEDAPDQPFVRSNGGTAHYIIQAFMDAVNNGRTPQPLADGMVYIVDETGLPQKPGDNQTVPSITLCHELQFWTGGEGTERARAWFKDNFGITFQEEERTLTFHEIRMRSAGQPHK